MISHLADLMNIEFALLRAVLAYTAWTSKEMWDAFVSLVAHNTAFPNYVLQVVVCLVAQRACLKCVYPDVL